jgi:ureidoglycolate lyase
MTGTEPRRLVPQPLNREAFAEYGEVIGTEAAVNFPINDGMATRFHELATVETAGDNARAIINLFRAKPHDFPIRIAMMERHPLGSQAFLALHRRPWLVVVAPDDGGQPGEPRAFRVDPAESGFIGVNYARNVWHHPLLALEDESDFIVVDRGGDGDNLQEFTYPQAYAIVSAR